ncbi:hypothetical protein Ciccas_004657 [Cichlidogyrus casuarinus]|uniref:Uncharacterized protein n=1 Tax=Cichlidogyrus casuarinus TaxID=1844966 RepID=A0ABD2QAV7_9PLAT
MGLLYETTWQKEVLSHPNDKQGVFLHKMATGLWAGFIMLLCGAHGIVAVVKPHMCTMVSMLVFCIITCLAATLLACVSIAGLIEDGFSLNSLTVNFAEPFSASQLNQAVSRVRLHQVILHILLLVVGLLEASVVVSSAILCCRFICPGYLSRRRFVNACFPSRYDYNRNQDHFLALQADVEEYANMQQHLLNQGLPPRSLSPTLHPTAQSFLPESTRRALILTHSEMGPLAISAAHATALCLGQRQLEQNPSRLNSPNSQRSAGEQGQEVQLGQSRKQVLDKLMRMFAGRRRRAAGQDEQGVSPVVTQMASNSVNQILRSDQRSSYVYVMPSPTAGEPPIIFPPFPPPYSSGSNEVPRRTSNVTSPLPPIVGRLPRVSSRTSAAFGRRNAPLLQANSSILIGGDRILQPVLIVQEDDPIPSYYGADEQRPLMVSIDPMIPPPEYSSRPDTPGSVRNS